MFKKKILISLFASAFIAGAFWSKKSLDAAGWGQRVRVLLPPPPGLKRIVLGHEHTIADFLWIRTIQDIDYCEIKDCQNSWTFKMLDVITDLSPDFRMPYSIGSLSLSLISEDVSGASRIYEKAMAHFPLEWTYPYRAGFHAMEYEKKPEKAANLFKLAAELGAPQWIYSLATKNYLKAGRGELAKLMLDTLEREKIPEDILERIRRRIKTQNSGSMVDQKEN